MGAPLRDGDIYLWRWADPARDNAGMWGDYHCYSRIALVRNGQLFDTYWSSDQKKLDPNQVVLTYLGNPTTDLNVIPHYQAVYYRPEDVVDTRHSNNSSAPVYIRAGAVRDATTMHLEVVRRIEDEKSTIRCAQAALTRLEADLELILSGKLEEVRL
jgi:hypothetical protein